MQKRGSTSGAFTKAPERESQKPAKESARDIVKIKSRYEGLMKRADGIRKRGESTVETLVSSAEVSASSFALGVVQGKYGPVSVVGVPLDLTVAAGLHLAGFLGLGGKASSHLHSFGDGALASFFFTLGRGTGAKWKATGPTVSGGERLTDEDLSALTGKKAA